MTKQTIQLCHDLLFGSSTEVARYQDDPISPELSSDYGKLIAARKLGKLPRSIIVDSAFCRAALSSTEDDRVRLESLQQLLNSGSALLDGVLFALLFDTDEEMRRAAVEGIALSRRESLPLALEVLGNDDSDAICMLAKQALTGQPIELYWLDSPS